MTILRLDWKAAKPDGSHTVSGNGKNMDVAVSTHVKNEDESPFTLSDSEGVLTAQNNNEPISLFITFPEPVKNVSFKLRDVDVATYGTQIDVIGLNTDGIQMRASFTDVASACIDTHDVEVVISGPITRLEVVLKPDSDTPLSAGVGITGITFSTLEAVGYVADAIHSVVDKTNIDILNLTRANVASVNYAQHDPRAGSVTFIDGPTVAFSEIEKVIPCFTAGSAIATPKGERPVEDLKVGDRILTRDNGIQHITWCGTKVVDTEALEQAPNLLPVMVRAGALGDRLPDRDMLVSPNHRFLIQSQTAQLYFGENEILMASKHMTKMKGVQVAKAPRAKYIHFMCENHELVLSDGVWSETFQPGDHSLRGIDTAQREELFGLFPELATKEGVRNYRAARKSVNKNEARLFFRK